MVDKTFRKLMFRHLSMALGRWKDVCVHRNAQEAKARQVLHKLRTGLVRQAFDRYLLFLSKSQQHSRNEKSADYIIEVYRNKEKQKIFNAWCVYVHNMLVIKRSWRKVLTRLDHFQKQRALKRWSENGNLKL